MRCLLLILMLFLVTALSGCTRDNNISDSNTGFVEDKISQKVLSGDVRVAVVELIHVDNPRANDFFEFYCNQEDCVFRSSDQDADVFVRRCGSNCNVEKKTLLQIFNNPEGITNIYPIGKSEAKYSYLSVYQIRSFYEQEARRYGVNLNLNIDIFGPYTVSVYPPKRMSTDTPEELEAYFVTEAQKNGLDLSSYDVVNYVYFDDSYTFRSTASKNQTFTDVILDVENIRNIQTIMHEMAHVFGAIGNGEDYGNGGICKYPQGYTEPDKVPLYPQSSACLMCGSIMESETSIAAVNNIDNLKICDKTAIEFGWK